MSTMSDAAPLVRTEHLAKVYPDGEVNALVDVSISIPRGQYVAVMGRSGCGKSTLLNLLGALDKPTRGEVFWEGEPLSKHPNQEQFRARKIGFVFQSFLLLPTLTAAENVQVPMFEGTLAASARAKRARDLLDVVGLGHRPNHMATKLSVGERQRVAIARALANEPVAILADEPTGNLDSKTAAEVLALFEKLHREMKLTFIVVTHSEELAQRAERTIRLQDGLVMQDAMNR
jgi:putative ABC transport system ATP-binding protein